jgi:hypothetical protein
MINEYSYFYFYCKTQVKSRSIIGSKADPLFLE